MNFRGSHVLSIDQFDLEGVATLFQIAHEVEPYARRRKITRVLEGAVLGNFFFEPSTRTRLSFGAAFNRLGGAVRDTTGFEYSSFAKGESNQDASRVIAGYVDAMVIRHPTQGQVHEFAKASHIPVLNGGDGAGEHPTQALLDLFTIHKETGRSLDGMVGLHVAMVGDLKYGRTVHSLVKLMTLLRDVTFHFVAPDALQMPEPLMQLALQRGHHVELCDSLIEGIRHAHVIYTTRLQEERFPSPKEAEKYRGFFVINRAIFEEHAQPGAIILHPLPRDSRPGKIDLDPDLNRHPALAIFRQADNGVAVRMALFALVLGVADRIHQQVRDVVWFVPDRFGVDDPL